jgi:hypothetical protein
MSVSDFFPARRSAVQLLHDYTAPRETMAPVHVEEVPPPSAADSQITSFLASSIFTSLPIGLPGPSGPRKACSSPCAERRQVEISHGSSVQRRHKFARLWRVRLL